MGAKFLLLPSNQFLRDRKSLTAQEQKQVDRKLDFLSTDPSHPSLRTKRVKGTVDLFERSVNMSIRIIWHYGDDGTIVLTEVGHHDILKRF